jgi:hypothetical protein
MKQRKLIIFPIRILFGILLLNNISVWGQSGVNTIEPASTLDVQAIKTATHVAGIIAPRLTLSELTSKGNSLYGPDQTGAIIYIKDVTGGGNTGQRINIQSEGYYYFDGALWVGLDVFNESQGFGRIKESFKTTDHSGWYLLNGRALSTLPANVRTVAASLGFSGNLPDATNRVLKTKSGSEALASIGGVNSLVITQANLPNLSLSGTFTGASVSAGAHTHSLSATSSSTSHAHSLSSVVSSSTSHTHGLTMSSTNNTHTHTFSATSTTNGAHTHTYWMPTRVASNQLGNLSGFYNMTAATTKATASAGAHTHTFSGTSASGGAAHTHTVTGSVASAGGAHTHTVSGIVTSGGAAHTHAISGTSASGGAAHTHAISGTASVATGGAATPIDNRPAYVAVNTFVYLGQ